VDNSLKEETLSTIIKIPSLNEIKVLSVMNFILIQKVKFSFRLQVQAKGAENQLVLKQNLLGL